MAVPQRTPAQWQVTDYRPRRGDSQEGSTRRQGIDGRACGTVPLPLPVIFRPIEGVAALDRSTASIAPIAAETSWDELNGDIGIEEPDTGEVSAMMSAIALDISSRTGAARVALKAMFSARYRWRS
jgi:hypothetical protein